MSTGTGHDVRAERIDGDRGNRVMRRGELLDDADAVHDRGGHQLGDEALQTCEVGCLQAFDDPLIGAEERTVRPAANCHPGVEAFPEKLPHPMTEHPAAAEYQDPHVSHTSNHKECPTIANHRPSLRSGTRLPARLSLSSGQSCVSGNSTHLYSRTRSGSQSWCGTAAGMRIR